VVEPYVSRETSCSPADRVQVSESGRVCGEQRSVAGSNESSSSLPVVVGHAAHLRSHMFTPISERVNPATPARRCVPRYVIKMPASPACVDGRGCGCGGRMTGIFVSDRVCGPAAERRALPQRWPELCRPGALRGRPRRPVRCRRRGYRLLLRRLRCRTGRQCGHPPMPIAARTDAHLAPRFPHVPLTPVSSMPR